MPHSETAKIRPYIWPWICEGRGIDLGCGFDKIHPECIGVDQFQNPAVDAICGITDLSQWQDGDFDWVFSSHAIEDIPDTDAILKEWFRILQPDGCMILYCPYRHYYPNVGQPGANQDHVHDFVPSDLISAMRRSEPSVWFVTAEVRGHKRTDEFHEYSCLVIARKRPPEVPEILIENNHQIGDTLSVAPLCGILRDMLPGCSITLAMDTADVLRHVRVGGQPAVDQIGREKKPYDLIVHQRTNATEHGDYLRRTTHFTQFTARVCAEILPGVLERLPHNVCEPITLPYAVHPDDFVGCPEVPEKYVAFAPDTYPPRRWPHEKWRQLAKWLAAQGTTVVVLGSEVRKGETFESDVLDLRGKTSFRQACAVLSKAKLLVSIDTSFVHIAQSLGVEHVVLMGPSSFQTTFYSNSWSVWRADRGCTGCYNWTRTDDDQLYEWNDTSRWPFLPFSSTTYDEGEQLPMYTQPACRNFNSGVECMAAIRLRDVKAEVAKRLDEVQADSDPRTLAAAYIVRNEEDNLSRSLDSVVGLVDAVVVVDTGSTDKTVDIAKQWSQRNAVPLKMHYFEWCDDFAIAKNVAIEQVETSHFIWLDADDVVQDPVGLRNFFDTTEYDVYHLWTDAGGRFRRERIAPRTARWEFPIHECLRIGGMPFVYTDFVIDHRPSDPKHWIGSLERNRHILEIWLAREPKDNRATFYLAETLRQQNEWPAAAELYRAHAERGTDFYEYVFLSAYQMSRYNLHVKEWQEAAKWGLKAIHVDPFCREAYYVVGDAYFWMGWYQVAYAWFLAAHNIPRPDRSLWREDSIYDHLTVTQLSYCCERLGRIDEALRWAKLGGSAERVAQLAGRGD